MKTDADLARAAVPLAAKQGDAALFDRLVGVLKNPKTPEIRVLALMALGGFEEPKLVERTLGLTLDGTVKLQDVRYVFPPLATRRSTRDVTYAWIEKHWAELTKIFPPFVIGRLAQVPNAMCDSARVRAAEAFLRPRVEKIEGTEKNLNQAVEEGLRCAVLAEKERAPTEKWLNASK
jgi:aminopeptidase N